MNPPGQSSMEALHTITLHIYIYIYREREREREEGDEPPLVNQAWRPCILVHYIYIEEGDDPPGQSSIEALHTITPSI